jgi:hypothetical protein
MYCVTSRFLATLFSLFVLLSQIDMRSIQLFQFNAYSQLQVFFVAREMFKCIFILSLHCPERTCPVHTSNIPSTKSHIHFLSFRSFIQGICPGPRLLLIFRNKLIYYGEEFLAPHSTSKLEDHPLSALRDCSFNIFAATLHPQHEDAPCRGDKGPT